MDISIYEYTRQKLLTHGVEKTEDGNLVLTDKKLFLLFVKLERARRLKDFDTVQAAVRTIEDYVGSIGKRHLAIFAYMYLRFSDATPKKFLADEKLEGGGVRKMKEFRRQVTDEEVAIGAWATVNYDRYKDGFFRILYKKSREERVHLQTVAPTAV